MPSKVVNVRIKYGGQVMAFECGDLSPSLGDWVLVKSGDDLPYLGMVVTNPVVWPKKQTGEPQGELACPRIQVTTCSCPLAFNRHVVRLATAADLTQQAENHLKETEAFDYCLARIAAQGLNMKLVAVEIVFDGSKTIFYYTSDERVDFRLLVKELVSRFRTRIEMRQIGSRHEARMVGGLGPCGQPFCCVGFLANFAPVSVKMAKEQSISLNPTKISGICGRLMCCLAFENQGDADSQTDNDL